MYGAIYNLWEKESNDSSYVSLFKNYDEAKDDYNKTYIDYKPFQKNNEWSVAFRQSGNEAVKDEKWHDVMHMYNNILSYAEIGSENVSLAYANRSLCFLKLQMYDKCLVDIKLAINANYPEKLRNKLEERHKFCLNKLKGIKPIENNEPKLSYNENKHFPGLANVVQMKYNSGNFEHLFAKNDIDVGRVILVEEAFVTTRRDDFDEMRNHVCGKCCKRTMNFIACNKCANTLFCSQKCAESDELHEIICGDGIVYDDSMIALAMRSIFLAIKIFPNIQSLIEFVESVENNTEKRPPNTLEYMKLKYRTFLKFNRWIGLSSEGEQNCLLSKSMHTFFRMMNKPVIQSKFKSIDEQKFLMHLIFKHLIVIYSHLNQNNILCHMFLIDKHINHSCTPNLIKSIHANKSIIIVTRPIKKGEQLFIDKHTIDPNYLWDEDDDYIFPAWKCHCGKCSNSNWPISLERIKLDPDYQYLLNQMDEKKIDYNDNSKCLILKQICLMLLKRYQDVSWRTEIDTVSKNLRTLLNETSTVYWSKLMLD